MAANAGNPIQDLCAEVTCPICLDFFKKPVTIVECGHNFCQGCLTQCREGTWEYTKCPQCRRIFQQKSLMPNQHLANFVGIAKKFRSQEAKRQEQACKKHQEPLKLFCQEEETPICVVCDRSKEHQCHMVIPVEEAAQKYKDQICYCLKNLRQAREKMLKHKASAEEEKQVLLKQTKAEREKTLAEFKEFHQFLEEQEKHLLFQIEEVEKEIARTTDEYMAELSRELSSLESLIQEMEAKCQQSPSELLQDVRKTLQRYERKETLQNPLALPVTLKWRISEFWDINSCLESVVKQVKDTLLCELQLHKENVTLDPGTAHPKLILSEDLKSLRWGEKYQDLPNNSERFDEWPFVLGQERFTSGRHYWDVTVGSEEEWGVGVASRTLKRKGDIDFNPDQGIWAVGRWAGTYAALKEPDFPSLLLTEKPKRIRVSLNYTGRRVAFFDADKAILLFAFSALTFPGEDLHPFFFANGKAYLTLSP